MSASGDTPLSVDLITHFLENQTKELDLKKQEDESRKQFAKYNFELAKASMQAQRENLENARKHREILWGRWLRFGELTLFIIAMLIAWSLWLGKEQFILELLRVIFYGGSGMAVGAYYQKSKKQSYGGGTSGTE